jgi:hypothetical protein
LIVEKIQLEKLGLLDVRHGDCLDTMQYRGCGTYVCERVDVAGTRFRLHKSWSEYGYVCPPMFSDNPLPFWYFCNTGVEEAMVWPVVVLEGKRRA